MDQALWPLKSEQEEKSSFTSYIKFCFPVNCLLKKDLNLRSNHSPNVKRNWNAKQSPKKGFSKITENGYSKNGATQERKINSNNL